MPNRGAEITITVTGTLNGGHDYLGIFGMGKGMPAGTPYTLIYTFDDTKGEPMHSTLCPGSSTGTTGSGAESPGIAMLTIAGRSHSFGKGVAPRSSTWRSVASRCSISEISVEVREGRPPFESGIKTRFGTADGRGSLTREGDWRSVLMTTSVYGRNMYNEFGITRSGNNIGGTQSYLSVNTVTISR
jgi:hypothetical protein